jgi:hypothetical protein
MTTRPQHVFCPDPDLVGTLLYFLWFNMGLIPLLLPVRADPLVVRLDWPYLVGVTWS